MRFTSAKYQQNTGEMETEQESSHMHADPRLDSCTTLQTRALVAARRCMAPPAEKGSSQGGQQDQFSAAPRSALLTCMLQHKAHGCTQHVLEPGEYRVWEVRQGAMNMSSLTVWGAAERKDGFVLVY